MRWLRAGDGGPLLSLLCGAELESWILWTPSGYFEASSAEADDYVGWLVSEGPERAPSFFHLNDSEGDVGSNKDRHMLLGEGLIGVEPFRELVRDRRSQDVPMILETPQQNYEIAEDDASPDPYDLRMMELLRSLE